MDGADDGTPCVDGVAHCAHYDCGRASVQAACGLILHAGRASMNHRQQHLMTFISEVPGLAFLASSQQNASHCQAIQQLASVPVSFLIRHRPVLASSGRICVMYR